MAESTQEQDGLDDDDAGDWSEPDPRYSGTVFEEEWRAERAWVVRSDLSMCAHPLVGVFTAESYQTRGRDPDRAALAAAAPALYRALDKIVAEAGAGFAPATLEEANAALLAARTIGPDGATAQERLECIEGLTPFPTAAEELLAHEAASSAMGLIEHFLWSGALKGDVDLIEAFQKVIDFDAIRKLHQIAKERALLNPQYNPPDL